MSRRIFLSSLFCSLLAGPLWATNHLILIEGLHSSGNGAVQFIQLRALADFQTDLAPTRLVALNADGSVETVVFDFTASFPALNANETILLATPQFELDFGLTPDFVIPAGSLSFPDGRLVFLHEDPCPPFIVNCEIDAVAYGAFTGDNGVYGNPAPPLVDDFCYSLTRTGNTDNNEVDWTGDFSGIMATNNSGDSIGLICDFVFRRGDVNNDADVNVADSVYLLANLFNNGPEPPCLDAADINDDLLINIADAIYLLGFLFSGGPPPLPPFPDCDFGTVTLGCNASCL